MANVTVSVPTSNITVDTTNSIVNVASTVSNVLVGESVFISNSEVRAAISVSNESGFGNLAYDNSTGSNGIIQYTGVSTSDIRGQLSATAPITYNSGTGVIDIDSSAIFTGKTTDDLAQGTTNIYFSTSGATVNTDALPEGSTNEYFTVARANSAIDARLPNTDSLAEGSTNVYFTDARARGTIQVNDTGGDGSLSYSSASGVFTYTGPSASETRAHFSGGTGIDYSSATGVIALSDTDLISGVTAGSGLTGGGDSGNITINVGQGDGITVNSNDIAVDTTVVRTTGAANISGLKTFYNDGIQTKGVSSGDLAEASFINTDVRIDGGGDFHANVPVKINLFDVDLYRANINQELGTGSSSNPYQTNIFNDHGIKYYGNINLESRVTTPGSESNTYVQTDMTRSRTVKTNYLFMGSNASIGSNVLYSTTSPAAAIAPEAVSTTAGTPLFEVFTANASVWADPDTSQSLDSGSANRRITKVGELVDTNNPQTIGGAKTFTTDLVVQGNVDVSGNLNYVEVQDLLVRENTITMNYGNSSVNTTSQVIVDRTAYPGGGASNAALIWQENLDKWQLNDGTNTSDIITSLNIGSHAVTTVNGASGPSVVLETDDVTEGTNNKYFTTTGAAVNTDNLTEGSTNLYFTNARADARVNAVLPNTDSLSEGSTNLYYTDARSRAAVSVTQASASGSGSLAYDSGSGVFTYTPPVLPTGDITAVTAGSGLTGGGTSGAVTLDVVGGYGITVNADNIEITNAEIQAQANIAIGNNTTDNLSEGATNLYYTTDRANTAIIDYLDGTNVTISSDSNITTTANIQGNYIIADTQFEGDINGAVLLKVFNNTSTTIEKGNVVYLTGGNSGDQPYVDNARADSASTMPVAGIAKEPITASSPGEIVTLGELTGLDLTGFTTGDVLYVSTSTAGAFQNTVPTSEAHLIQNIGKVVNGGSGGALEFTGAGRTNATPNLDEGNIFLGSSSNTAITVTPDSNFETTSNAFSLSNSLTDVNTITTESGSGLTFNSSDGTIVTSKFGINSTVTETANIAGKGFGVFNYTNGLSTTISYSGTDVFEWYEIDGSVVSGSTTMTITSVVRGIDSTTAAVSDIIVGQVIANGTSASTPGSTDMIIFPDDAYVVSVNSGAGTVEMSQPAVQTTSFTHTTDGIILDAGLVDTTTGLVIKLLSDLRAFGGGSTSSLAFRSFRNFPFGYPASGPVPTDFDIITAGTASDYSMSLSTFMLGQTPITNDTTVLNAPLGITIGENAQLTNRAENDGFSSFGMNMMWDGLTSYSRAIQPQVLFKSYTDNAEQSSAVFTAGAGPRLFFSSADGNSGDNAFQTYPKANQELGRLAFWGTTGEQLTPSSYNVPGFISVAAADDWDTWGGGVAGNTNVYMGATSDGLNPDTYLSYKEGELLLGSNSSKPITFAPAYNGSARDPDDAYTGNYTTWANVNYSNTGAAKGAKLSVTNGGSDGVGVVGDLEIGVFRNDITDGGSNVTVANNYYSGQTNYYSSISINAGPTLIFGAVFGTNVDLSGLNDGDQATFDNYTGTLGGEINGNTYYVKVIPNTGGSPLQNPLYANYAVGLYDDAALTTPTTLTSSSGDYSNAGTIEYTGLPSVTDREYKFKLEEQSEKLQFVTVDATPTSTTLIEYSEAITDFKNRVKLKSHTSAEILALTGMTAGEMVYNSTDNLVAYYDGTNWRNIAQGAIIT